MTKLKRCPFCGGEAEMIKMGQYNGEIIYNSNGEPRIRPFIVIGCKDCGARIEEQDEEELVDMWNTRTPEIVRCGECKHFDGSEIAGRCALTTPENLEDNEVYWEIADFCSYGERREENASTD